MNKEGEEGKDGGSKVEREGEEDEEGGRGRLRRRKVEREKE